MNKKTFISAIARFIDDADYAETASLCAKIAPKLNERNQLCKSSK